MDTTQEPEITLVELDNILAGELDQKWSALSDSMKQFVFEQVKGKENFSAAYYAAKDLVEGAHANALNLDIGCRLDLSVFLTQSLVACADPDDQKLYERAREIADECGLPALRWQRIGYAVAMLTRRSSCMESTRSAPAIRRSKSLFHTSGSRSTG